MPESFQGEDGKIYSTQYDNVFGLVKIDYRGDTRWIPAADLRW